MLRKSLFPLAILSSLFLVVALSLVLQSCGSEPAGTGGLRGPLTGKGEIDPNGAADFQLGSTAVDGYPDARVEVWVHNLTLETDSVVSFDVVLVNASAMALEPPVRFFITHLDPPSVEVLNPDFIGREGPVGFDFSDDLGEDGRLTPGESSAPVNMRFGTPGPISFAIGFEITANVVPVSGDLISGVVFLDRNQDGHFDPQSEEGIPRVNVSRTVADSTTGVVVWTYTDEAGRYGFDQVAAGVHRVQANIPYIRDWTATTPNPLLVTLIEDADGHVIPFTRANFGFFRPEPPPPIVKVFGPLAVGPGSPVGTHADTSFVNEDGTDGQWTLDVVEPPFAGPFPPQIWHASVTINNTVIWSFDCPQDSTLCWPPTGQFPIPSSVIQPGVNALDIVTEGEDYGWLYYSILHSQ